MIISNNTKINEDKQINVFIMWTDHAIFDMNFLECLFAGFFIRV